MQHKNEFWNMWIHMCFWTCECMNILDGIFWKWFSFMTLNDYKAVNILAEILNGEKLSQLYLIFY